MSFLPDWIFHVVMLTGIFVLLGSFILKFIPIFKTYNLVLQLVGIILTTAGVWFEGAMSNQAEWEAKVKEVEAKVAAAEVKSAEANVEVVTKFVNKTKVIHDKGQDIINYVDREVVKDKEVIKFVENCPIPSIVIKAHNAGALNQPIEVPKAAEPTATPAETEAKPAAKAETASSDTKENPTAKVKAWSNLRATKDSAGDKIDKLAPGELVAVLKVDATHVLVKHHDKQGWVSKEFINLVGVKV